MATQQEIIQAFVNSLDRTNLRGTAAVDEAVKACSSFTSYKDLMEQFLADRKNCKDGDEFLRKYCGIILDNEDTGAITGADAGGSVVKTAESVVPETAGKSVYPPNNSFSYKGLTVNVPDASKLTENQKNIVAGIYTWWLKGGLDLAEETYGFSFEDNDVSFKTITIDFNMGSYSNLTSYCNYYSSNGKMYGITFHINSNLYKNLKNTDSNGAGDSSDTPFLDRVIGKRLIRMLLDSKINYEYELPSAIGKGLSAIADGGDDRYKNEILELANDTQKLENFSISNGRADTVTYLTHYQDYAAGYMLLRYLAKQTADPTPAEINIPADAFEYNGHYYYIYSNVVSTWEGAQKYCKNLGGNLAVINDAAENTALFNYMKSKGYDSAYFGLSDAVKEGTWDWVDSTPVTYTNWASGEPNNQGFKENYGMFYWKFTDGKWNDGDFGGSTDRGGKAFICEWEKSGDEETEIDDETTLEVINLFKGLSTSEKSTALQENVKSLEAIQELIEGEKNIEIIDKETGETVNTDVQNIMRLFGSYFNFKTPELINDLTKYVRDGHLKIYYAKDGDGVEILDANGQKIKFEDTNKKFLGAGFGAIFYIDSAINSIKNIHSGKLQGAELGKEISNINSYVAGLVGNISDLGGFDKAGAIAPIAASALSAIGSIIAWTDGVEPKEIVDVFSKTLQFSTTLVKKFSTSDFLKTTKLGKFLTENPIGQKLSASALKANLITAGVLGVYMGGVQYFESAEKYAIDGLEDSLAAKDKWVDVFGTATKTFSNVVTLGLDDAAFGFLSAGVTNLVYLGECFGTWITGGDVSKVQRMSTGGKNYMELFGDFVKLVFFNQYTDPNLDGTENGYMENTKDGRIIYGGGGNDSINNKASKANIYGGTGNDLIFCAEGTNQQYIDGGNGNDHIALYGSSNEIHGGLGDDQIDIFGDSKNPAGGNYILGEAGNDYIWIGDGKSKKKSSAANSINGGAGDDVIFIDQTKTSNIIFYNNGDGDDEIFGYDSNDQIRINKSNYTTQINGDDVKIIVGNGSMILYDAKDKKLKITRTDIDIMPPGMTADKNNTTLTIRNKFKAQNVHLEDYAETFTKVNASGLAKTQTVEIIGNDKNNSIKGGKGADTISGGGGKNTLAGGAGEDIFIYSGGNDFITDYKPGEDKLKINYTSSTVSGSNVILTTSTGNVTVKGAKDKVVTFVDDSGNTTDRIFFGNTSYTPLDSNLKYDSKRITLTADKKFTGSKIDLKNFLSTATKVNAPALSNGISIVGTAAENSLKAGKGADKIYGGAGHDTLYGGAGNDSLFGENGNDKIFGDAGSDTLSGGNGDDILTGGKGADFFIYTSGHDTITDYAAEDTIKIKGKISRTSYSGKNVIFSIGSGTLTVQKGKGKKITITDSNNKTTTKTYTEGVSARTADLFCDNNFITDDAQISDISEQKFEVTNIETVNADTFAQVSVLAYSNEEQK